MKVHSTGLALIPSLLSLLLAAFFLLLFLPCVPKLREVLKMLSEATKSQTVTMARLVEHLPGIHEAIGLIPSIALARCHSIHL